MLGSPRHLLIKAQIIWEQGDAIPIDLAAALMACGYDVEKLEARYRK